MKKFESFLASRLAAYAAHRIELGHSATGMFVELRALDRFLVQQNADWHSLTPALFIALRQQMQAQPEWVNGILWRARSVVQFLLRCGDLDHDPVADVPFVTKRIFVPFIFAPEQVDRLLRAVGQHLRHTPRHYLGDLAVYTALMLIARCGMRIREPINLHNHHFAATERTVYIEKTKFKKDRLIPVPAAVARQVENYLAAKSAWMKNKKSPYLLVGADGHGLSDGRIYRHFHAGLKAAGIVAPRRVFGDVVFGSPTVHCLRHSFAVNTLKRIKNRGDSVQHALPVLAAYMGHCKYRYTGTYLKVLDADQRQGLIEFARARVEL